jgi:hypothetical protein
VVVVEYLTWVWKSFIDLTWWQMTLWVLYTIYFLFRSFHIWDAVSDYGIRKGYKQVFIGCSRYLRLYHVLRMIFDIPPMIVGLTFPVFKKIFSLKLYEFKQEQ